MKTNPDHPIHPASPHRDSYSGLTVLEHFSGLAMQGLLTKEGHYDRIINEGGCTTERGKIAEASVIMAKALIQELNKSEQ